MPRDAAQVHFDTLAIEGGLFTAEWLGKVASFAAPAQGDADYQVRAGFTLREEIALAWRSAQALWAQFDKSRNTAGHDAAVTQRLITELLKQSFGFQLHAALAPVSADGRNFPIRHFAFEGTVPVVIGPHALSLDAPDLRFGDPAGTRRRRSAFGLLQEYLNAQTTPLWGLASNGLSLRLARDNVSLTRPAWLEADLERLFQEERFAEFSLLWLLLHATRFGGENVAPSECVLERWRDACRDQGVRARDVLRQGVEHALLTLGNGFLAQPANGTLRQWVSSHPDHTRHYFQQLLRLVYRLIFLLTVEERSVLHASDADAAARELYAEGYSLRRLRDRAVRRSAHDRHHDLWEGLKLVWKGLAAGEPRLALPALGGLFAPAQCAQLDVAKIENRHLLLGLFHLAWLRNKDQLSSPLTRVNWRDMGPEELGSIYESLLELVPQVGDGGRRFSFLEGTEARGNARKTTGSYYTPDSLVQLLLDSALEPVIADRLAEHPAGAPAVEALLSISVVDPACGSGHFLLGAARRIATYLARVLAEHAGSGQPAPADYRHALRQVIGRCIFGVDLNPMAVELCKVSLWLEAVEPGLPLTFLNSHIQQGNALLGATPELMVNGIPNAAWEPIEGDDKKVAGALKRRNKQAAAGQRVLDGVWAAPSQTEALAVARAVAELDAESDASAEALARKESQWDRLLQSEEYRHQKLVADAWCAAFVWPKQEGELADVAPTNELWRQWRDGEVKPPAHAVTTIESLAKQFSLFHWHLQFSQVFKRGGFNVVIGNPPWERASLEEIPFFASKSPSISAAPTTAIRRGMIQALQVTDPQLHTEYLREKRRASGESAFVSRCGAFQLTAIARIDSYALFAERALGLVAPAGLIGLLLPTGVATAYPLKDFWARLFVEQRRVHRLLDFENRSGYFPNVDSRKKFCILVLGGESKNSEYAEFGFFLPNPRSSDFDQSLMQVTPQQLLLLNASGGQPPIVRSKRDLELLVRIYENAAGKTVQTPGWVGYTSAGTGDTWLASKDVDEERIRSSLMGLIEGKMINQFDHRFATYQGCSEDEIAKGLPKRTLSLRDSPQFQPKPRFYVPRSGAISFRSRKIPSGWFGGVYRDYTSATNERTLIAALAPSVIPMQPLNGFSASSATEALFLVARLNSIAIDYAARQITPDIHLNVTIFNSLPGPPLLRPNGLASLCDVPRFVVDRALELSYTSWDMYELAEAAGFNGPPFKWSDARRFLLRAELDAAFLHLYGLSRKESDYVLDTFPIVRRNDEKAHGDYRTKRVILEIYDAMAEAIRTGKPYQSRLDPPPSDPRVAHPDQRPEWALLAKKATE